MNNRFNSEKSRFHKPNDVQCLLSLNLDEMTVWIDENLKPLNDVRGVIKSIRDRAGLVFSLGYC